jgi:hypothetical protein
VGAHSSFELYLGRLRPEIERHRDFLKEAVEHDKIRTLLSSLPLELQSDPDLLKSAVENLCGSFINTFLYSVPVETLIEHEFVLSGLRKGLQKPIDHDKIPPSLWQNRDFIIKSSEKRDQLRLPLFQKSSVTTARYVSLRAGATFAEAKHGSNSFLADKSFVIECLKQSPKDF